MQLTAQCPKRRNILSISCFFFAALLENSFEHYRAFQWHFSVSSKFKQRMGGTPDRNSDGGRERNCTYFFFFQDRILRSAAAANTSTKPYKHILSFISKIRKKKKLGFLKVTWKIPIWDETDGVRFSLLLLEPRAFIKLVGLLSLLFVHKLIFKWV